MAANRLARPDGTNRSTRAIARTLDRRSASWPDDLWAGAMGWLDAIIRGFYGIYEFTDAPNCLLRVGLSRAGTPVLLAGGTPD